MCNVLNEFAPNSLVDIFVPETDITEYNLRNFHTFLQLPHPKAEKNEEKFFLFWNFGMALPTDFVMPIRFRHFVGKLADTNN